MPHSLNRSHTSYLPTYEDGSSHPDYLVPRGSGYFSSQNFSRTIAHIFNRSHTSYLSTYEDGTDSVPKRWHLNYRRWEITQKKVYDIQNTAKVWNQEYFKISFNIL
jgi:hypothetical protein